MYDKVTCRGKRHRKSVDFGVSDEIFETLGDRIISAAKYGADMGSYMSVSFDEYADPDAKDFKHEVDVLSDPNQDLFEIAEQFGQMVEQMAPPQQTNE